MNVRRQDRGRPPIPSTPRRQTIDPCNKVARLNCIAHLLARVPYKDLNPVETALPPRQSDSDYKRPKITSQRFVPDIY